MTRTYTLGIAGESHLNDDGTSRQKIIKTTWAGDSLTLRREPENQYDANAVAVLAAGGMIGYINAKDAEWVAEAMDKGKPVSATLKSRAKAGPFLSRKWGVRIDLTVG